MKKKEIDFTKTLIRITNEEIKKGELQQEHSIGAPEYIKV